mgnify:CR=1 FL=1
MPRIDQIPGLRSARPALAGGAESEVFSWPDDFTYEGSFRIPVSPISGVESRYGDGVTFVDRAADAGNEEHLIFLGFGAGSNHQMYEVRVPTPGMGGADPKVLTNFPLATVVKEYGDVYDSKKKIMYNGVETQLTVSLDGSAGLHHDSVDDLVYVVYGFGYSTQDPADVESWSILRTTLNYAAGTGTSEGPWRFFDSTSGGQKWKALMGGLATAPTAFATTYLGGKRLLIGWGGYFSVITGDDCSLGGSVSAFDPDDIPAEEGWIPSADLFGFWPYVSEPDGTHGHGDRLNDRIATVYEVDGWGIDKDTWDDRWRAGVCPTGHPTKTGIILFGAEAEQVSNYISSQLASTYKRHRVAVWDLLRTKPVTSTPRYEIQADQIVEHQFPTIDYTQVQYAGGTPKTVTSITASGLQTGAANCLVNCVGHGLTQGKYVEIRGGNRTEYVKIWQIPNFIDDRSDGSCTAGDTTVTIPFSNPLFDANCVGLYLEAVSGTNVVPGKYLITAFNTSQSVEVASSPTPSGSTTNMRFNVGGIVDDDNFFMFNTSAGGTEWSGVAPTGSITAQLVDGNADRIFGATDDPVRRKVYVAYSVLKGVNNIDGFLMVDRFSY